jgi:flagellin-like hook-associated protein FlgL
MADLRTRFIEDYAGGLLNISRQEFSTTGEVASQDGLPTDGKSLYVEDGSGNKSGLKLGISLAEVVDPTTEEGCVNVRFADRTYAKQRDLKLLATSLASVQGALVDSVSASLTNLETGFQLLESDVSGIQNVVSTMADRVDSVSLIASDVTQIQTTLSTITSNISSINSQIQDILNRLQALESA